MADFWSRWWVPPSTRRNGYRKIFRNTEFSHHFNTRKVEWLNLLCCIKYTLESKERWLYRKQWWKQRSTIKEKLTYVGCFDWQMLLSAHFGFGSVSSVTGGLKNWPKMFPKSLANFSEPPVPFSNSTLFRRYHWCWVDPSCHRISESKRSTTESSPRALIWTVSKDFER